MDRREFLRLTAGGATLVALGGSCGSSSEKSRRQTAKASGPGGGGRTLRIAQWNHFVPAYDSWFDNEFARRWGEDHDVAVIVDHIPENDLPFRAEAEIAAGRGHDLFGFATPRPALEDAVIDHGEIIEEVAAKAGPLQPFVERSLHNPKTGRWFGVSDFWAPAAVHYRRSVWNDAASGSTPATWDAVRSAAGPLKALGYPVGVGLFSSEHDSAWTVGTLMQAFGAAMQDENAAVNLRTPATVEAVKLGAAIFRDGMNDEVFTWDSASNNRLLSSGKCSLIINPISGLRTIEQQAPELSEDIALAPVPLGPAGDVPRCERLVHCYVVWKFAEHADLARQFLVDLALASRDSFVRSTFYNLPSFPGTVSDLADLVRGESPAQAADRYSLLAGAGSWMSNIGAPGTLNAAVDEAFGRFILPRMFAAAARGEKTAEEAVADAEAEIRPIFDRWRERGKI